VKLIGYVRVSTAGQVEDGQGLEIQEQVIRRWVRANKHRLVSVIQDAGISGTTDEREGLTEALAAVRYNGADGLVVHTLDRLARSLTVQEAALQQVWSAGGRVFTVDQGEVLADDPEDPVRTFVRQVLGAVSQLEAGMIARRLRRGRQHKAEQGGYAFGGPPLGFRAEGGELVEDPEEMAVVERIRVLRDEGKSLRQIAEVLTGEGLRPKRSERWHPYTVKRVLDRIG
jgi:DNA invertase Pin-like site-specific DNA recombinase